MHFIHFINYYNFEKISISKIKINSFLALYNIIPYTNLSLLCVYKLQEALIKRSTWADSLAGHYAGIATSQYFTIAPAAVVGCNEPLFLQKPQHINLLELSNTIKWFATVTGFRIICSIVKILKRQTVTASVWFTVNSVEECVRYNIRNSSHHFGPSVIIVTSQSALKH